MEKEKLELLLSLIDEYESKYPDYENIGIRAMVELDLLALETKE